MTITKPQRETFLLPPGATEANYAEHQSQYLTLPVIRTRDGKVASQWMPTPGELALLNEGVPVTLVMWTFNHPLQPISLMVGGADLR